MVVLHAFSRLKQEKAHIMILIALGANLDSHVGSPRETCMSALDDLNELNVSTIKLSRWYQSAPVPASDQPYYLNAVAVVKTSHTPSELLNILLAVEQKYGRTRSVKNAARTLDLDLLAYDDRVEKGSPDLPHPRLQDRAFVLLPLKEVAPDWHHPISGQTVETMISALDCPESAVPMA